jgi:penicillin-binding protein-related factor A (putative recombinase)
MKNEGKQFEEDWKNSYDKLPFFYLRLKDAAKWLQGSGSSFTPENPFDSIQFTMPYIWLLELKSTKGSSISFNPEKPYEKPKNKKTNVMIKANQVKELMKSVNKEGVIPGLILNFRPRETKKEKFDNATYFIHINDFIKFAEISKKSSINAMDCESIGVKVNGYLKVKNYKYDIMDFSEKSILKYLKCNYLDINHLIKTKKWIDSVINKLKA